MFTLPLSGILTSYSMHGIYYMYGYAARSLEVVVLLQWWRMPMCHGALCGSLHRGVVALPLCAVADIWQHASLVYIVIHRAYTSHAKLSRNCRGPRAYTTPHATEPRQPSNAAIERMMTPAAHATFCTDGQDSIDILKCHRQAAMAANLPSSVLR